MAALLSSLAFLVPAVTTPRKKQPAEELAPVAKEEPKPLTDARTPAERAPGTSTEDGVTLAGRVEAFYGTVTDFSADFSQVYKYRGVLRKVESAGRMQVKKPGFMRWDYEKPDKKLFLVDGKSLYLYSPEDNAVQVKKHFSSDSLSAAVTFLWGKGELVDSFSISKVNKPAYGATVLELIPKKTESGFTKLYYSIDGVSGAVLRSVVFDSSGNENQVTFSNMKTNQHIPESRFMFAIPNGMQVQYLDQK